MLCSDVYGASELSEMLQIRKSQVHPEQTKKALQWTQTGLRDVLETCFKFDETFYFCAFLGTVLWKDVFGSFSLYHHHQRLMSCNVCAIFWVLRIHTHPFIKNQSQRQNVHRGGLNGGGFAQALLIRNINNWRFERGENICGNWFHNFKILRIKERQN